MAITDDEGNSLLMRALANHEYNVAIKFIDEGIDIFHKNNAGKNAFDILLSPSPFESNMEDIPKDKSAIYDKMKPYMCFADGNKALNKGNLPLAQRIIDDKMQAASLPEIIALLKKTYKKHPTICYTIYGALFRTFSTTILMICTIGYYTIRNLKIPDVQKGLLLLLGECLGQITSQVTNLKNSRLKSIIPLMLTLLIAQCCDSVTGGVEPQRSHGTCSMPEPPWDPSGASTKVNGPQCLLPGPADPDVIARSIP